MWNLSIGYSRILFSSCMTEKEGEVFDDTDIKKLSELFCLLDNIDRRIKREEKGSNDK